MMEVVDKILWKDNLEKQLSPIASSDNFCQNILIDCLLACLLAPTSFAGMLDTFGATKLEATKTMQQILITHNTNKASQ